MNQRVIFFRKIMYLVAIGVLLGLLYLFGHPSTIDPKSGEVSPGGLLAQAREKSGLSQTELGQIDPTSETIKLATFGLRGVAVWMLWDKANEYKMKEDWTNFSAALNQIIKVQPHFISVWIHQAWNMSYNVSVEFDDYKERYRWVIKGIDYLKQGVEYNKYEPRLVWERAWVVAQKIGRADEHKQYRRLFKADDEFHNANGTPSLAQRDNWLVGKKIFLEAINLANDLNKGIGGKSPLIYLSDPPMSQMNYSEAIEKEGVFGEKALGAWRSATAEWRQYGSMPIPHTFGMTIYLNDQEKEEETAKKLVAELDAMQPGLREEIFKKKLSQLPDKQRIAYETSPEKRTQEQFQSAYEAEELLRVKHEEVARQIKDPKLRAKAKELAENAVKHEELANYIKGYRDTVNFNYWRLRADVEQTDEALNARKLIYLGDQAFREGYELDARNYYEEGLKSWRKVLDKFPALVEDELTGSDLMDIVNQYRKILNLLGESFPDNFVLQDIVARYSKKSGG
jgi:hypothetical protein